MTREGFGSEPAVKEDRYFGTDHLKLGLGSRTARGGAVTIISQGLKFVVSMAGTIFLARLLTPPDYGLVGMVAVVTGFVSIYKDLGLAAATIQSPRITAAQISTLFWLNIALSVAVALVCISIAPAVSWFYGEQRLTWITIVGGIGFIISGLSIQHEALLRRQMRFVALSAISIAAMLAGYIVGIGLAWKGYQYRALVISQLAVLSTSTIATWFACRWRPGLPRWDKDVRSMIKFGGYFTGFSTINYFSRNFDNLLIGRVWGAFQLGLYGKAYQLMMLPIDQINEPITSVAVPSLSRLTSHPEDYRRAFLRMLEKIALVTMPGVAAMIVTSDWIVTLVLGPQWTAVAPIFVVLGISGLFQPVMNAAGWLFITQGRTSDLFKLSWITGPITVLSIVVGLHWQAIGVAIAYVSVRLCVIDPIVYWYLGRRGPVRTMDFYRTILPIASASLCGLAAAFAFRRLQPQIAPLFGIALCFLIIGTVTLLALLMMPSGRRALQDIPTSIALLRGKRDDIVPHITHL